MQSSRLWHKYNLNVDVGLHSIVQNRLHLESTGW